MLAGALLPAFVEMTLTPCHALGIDSNASSASIAVMATLTIRNLPQEVYDRLRSRAAENRRSMEAEARAVLADGVTAAQARRNTLTPEDALRNLEEMMKHVKPKHGDSLVDEFLAERRAMWGEEE